MISLQTHRHNSSGKLFLTFLLLILSLSIARAQGGLGSTRGLPETSGGSNIIQGHVYFPEGQSNGKRLRINLESTDDTGKSTQTDEDGTFRFNSLKPGSYTIVVEGGKDYETVRENVFFEGSNRNNVVPIYLKAKGAEAAAFAGIPKSAVDLYKKAQDSIQKNDHKKAVEALSAAVAQAPNFALALSDLGAEYLKLKDANKAAETLEAALKLTPDEFTPRLNYGIALLNQKKFPEAETQLRLALRKNDGVATAHYYLGMALMSQKKYDDAATAFENTIKNGGDQMALAHKYLGGIYWGRKDYQRAADELEKYVKLDPKAADADKIRETIKQLRSSK